MNFEEFKEGFVTVLSRSLDFSTSEEESSYLEPGKKQENILIRAVCVSVVCLAN